MCEQPAVCQRTGSERVRTRRVRRGLPPRGYGSWGTRAPARFDTRQDGRAWEPPEHDRGAHDRWAVRGAWQAVSSDTGQAFFHGAHRAGHDYERDRRASSAFLVSSSLAEKRPMWHATRDGSHCANPGPETVSRRMSTRNTSTTAQISGRFAPSPSLPMRAEILPASSHRHELFGSEFGRLCRAPCPPACISIFLSPGQDNLTRCDPTPPGGPGIRGVLLPAAAEAAGRPTAGVAACSVLHRHRH